MAALSRGCKPRIQRHTTLAVGTMTELCGAFSLCCMSWTLSVALMNLKGGLNDSSHVRESKYCCSPVHAVASKQASSFNCIVNEPVVSELIAWV